jgi:hypothetical protein
MNSKIIIAAIVFTAIISSCSKSFLEVPLEGKPTTANDPTLSEKLVTGVYNTLLLGDTWGSGDIHGISFISATNIMSDDADKGSSPSDQAGIGELDNFTLTSTSVFAGSLWNGYYIGISRANFALANLAEAQGIDETKKNQYISEVRFLRGYYYFNLARFFGGVPKVLRVPTDANDANTDITFQTRAPLDTIYNVVISDLQFAINSLPLKQAQQGRITKGAAQTMLAKVYMYRKNWQKVYDLTSEVINSKIYSLTPDYSSIWKQAGNFNAESIFEVSTGKYDNSDFGIQNYSQFQGPRVGGMGGWRDLGWGFCNPSVSLINAYEPGDKRKDATIIFIDNSGLHHGTTLWDGFRIPSKDSVENLYYNYKAYHSEISKEEDFFYNRDLKMKNIHLLRYAEVLLINAEAANELGKSPEALINLNAVRNRAGLANSIAVSKDKIREAIWQERRVELALEHDRFFDLVRQGRVAQVMKDLGKNFTSNKNELLPIPAVQIQLSGGKLIQNNGY